MEANNHDIVEAIQQIYEQNINHETLSLRRSQLLQDYYCEIEEHGDKRIDDYYKVDDVSNEITVLDINNHPINKLLPKGMKIMYHPGATRYNAIERKVEVDTNTLAQSGEYGKAMLAHELGHGFDEIKVLEYARKTLEYKDKEGTATAKEKAEIWNDYLNLQAEIEINAWVEGKIISDLLGVDEVVYNDLMTCALAHRWSGFIYHFYDILDKNLSPTGKDIRLSLRRHLPFIQDKKYKLLNPITQEIQEFTFGELEVLKKQAENEEQKAYIEFYRKLIRKKITGLGKSVIDTFLKGAIPVTDFASIPSTSKWKR